MKKAKKAKKVNKKRVTEKVKADVIGDALTDFLEKTRKKLGQEDVSDVVYVSFQMLANIIRGIEGETALNRVIGHVLMHECDCDPDNE